MNPILITIMTIKLCLSAELIKCFAAKGFQELCLDVLIARHTRHLEQSTHGCMAAWMLISIEWSS